MYCINFSNLLLFAQSPWEPQFFWNRDFYDVILFSHGRPVTGLRSTPQCVLFPVTLKVCSKRDKYGTLNFIITVNLPSIARGFLWCLGTPYVTKRVPAQGGGRATKASVSTFRCRDTVATARTRPPLPLVTSAGFFKGRWGVNSQ